MTFKAQVNLVLVESYGRYKRKTISLIESLEISVKRYKKEHLKHFSLPFCITIYLKIVKNYFLKLNIFFSLKNFPQD